MKRPKLIAAYSALVGVPLLALIAVLRTGGHIAPAASVKGFPALESMKAPGSAPDCSFWSRKSL